MLKLYYSKDNKYIIAELYNKYSKVTVEYAENITILKQKILYKLVNPKPNNNVYRYLWKLFYNKIKNITEKEFINRLEENMEDNIDYVLFQ